MNKQKTITIIEDDVKVAKLIEHYLTKEGYKVVSKDRFNNLDEVEEFIFQVSPKIILCDIMMEPDGYEILKTMKENSQLRLIPFIFVTVKETLPSKVKAYMGGVDNYITKPIKRDELIAKVNSIITRQEQVETAIYLDPLTRIHNRRFFQKELNRQIKLHHRHKEKFTLALIDLDHFKAINDTYGHNCGDQCLIEVTKYIKDQIRSTDIFARWGGEEFFLLMERAQVEGARNSVNNILKDIKSQSLFTYKNQEIFVSFSAGLAEFPTHGNTAKELLEATDKALYLAKNLGRGRVEIFQP